eukprot:COSAG06_NODE_22538_length_720_cov_1.130435_1_plen_45_part_10
MCNCETRSGMITLYANHSARESAGQGGELNTGGAAKGLQRVGRKK